MHATLRGFDIRPATVKDIPRLAELEMIAFGNTGVHPYDHTYFECWLEINPTGLLVATRNDRVVAYRYSQYVNFSLDDIPNLTTNDAFTDRGFTRSTHRADGNCINGVTVCSDERGAGRVLFEAIFQQLETDRRRYYFGFARISGFDAYCRKLERDSVNTGAYSPQAIANWYATQCALSVNGKIWKQVTPERLDLPTPTDPDPVLSKYLKHHGFGIAAILPNWMVDPESRDFGVLVLFKNPLLQLP